MQTLDIKTMSAAQLRQAAELREQIENLERQLSDLGNGVAPKPARKKAKVKAKTADGSEAAPKNAVSLKDAVSAALKSNPPMSKDALLEAVQKSGYKFTAKDPKNSLNVVLYTNRETFAQNAEKHWTLK